MAQARGSLQGVPPLFPPDSAVSSPDATPLCTPDAASAIPTVAGAARISLPLTTPPSRSKELFLEFVSNFLGVRVFAIQPGYPPKHPDTYLFEGPHGTTMNVDVAVMLMERSAAVAFIQQRVADKKKAFGIVP
jgi:hypothetical protein